MSNPHIDATKEWLEYSAEQNPDNDGRATHAAALAQTEATLALAFETRTANLIAFANACETGSVGNGGSFRQAADRLGLGETK